MHQTVGGEADAMHALCLSVAELAQRLEPSALSPADAKRLHESAARAKALCAVIEAMALVRIDETEAYKSSGHRSAADYGAARAGGSRGDAQRAIKTEKRSRRLPDVDEARRRGDLSERQADEIADAASVNPDAEADLLRAAKTDDLGTLKRKAQRAKASAHPDLEARNRRIHARRSLRHWTNDAGEFHAHLCTTPEAGARFLAGLEPHRRAAFDAARKAGRREAPEAYAADALDAMARGGTDAPASREAAPSAATGTGRTAPTATSQPPASGEPAKPSAGSAPARSHPWASVQLHIDLAPLLRGHLEPGDVCEIPGVGPVSLTEARALLGDAVIELILKKGDDIRSVVHYGRTVTTAQRRALEARDPCCIRPGCGRTQNLEIDHRDGWAITRRTSLDELARLCPACHDLKTHHGHTYSGGPGTWRWHVPGDGPPAPDHPPGAPPDVADQAPLFSLA